MRCCSNFCERKSDCANHCMNSVGTHQVEDFYTFGSATISSEGCTVNDWCGENGNWRMFVQIKKQTDYEQWKDWLDKWNVKYEEKTWNPNEKELIVGGCYCQASVAFDLDEKFICMTAYE